MMHFSMQELKPFLCKSSDLESFFFQEMDKRQIIAPFQPYYYFARFLELN